MRLVDGLSPARRAARALSRPAGFVAVFLLAVALTALACGDINDDGAEVRTPTPPPAETERPGDDHEPTPPPPEPTPTPEPGVTGLSCDEREPHRSLLVNDVNEALQGYNGDWGFALYDLNCDHMTAINGDYIQYTASTSKIITIIAVMRAVEAGDVDLEAVEPHIDEVFEWSSDHDANVLEEFIDPADLDAVLADAGVSSQAYIDGSWNQAHMTAPDMARIWAGIIRGELLTEESARYLMDKTGLAEIPDGLETFPDARFEMDGFQYGQKAGYYVIDGIPYFMVGAGFLAEDDGPETFIPVFILRTENPEFLDPQRREVWPLVVEHVAEVTGTEMPADPGPGPWPE